MTCTNNYHVLFTDGETNQASLPTIAGEVDGAAMPARAANGTLPPNPGASRPERTLATLTAGANWPNPYKDVALPTANTLADVALYYWMQDLRPTLREQRSGERRALRQGPRLEAQPRVVAARELLGAVLRLRRAAGLQGRDRHRRRRVAHRPDRGGDGAVVHRPPTIRGRRTGPTTRPSRPRRAPPRRSTTCGTRR